MRVNRLPVLLLVCAGCSAPPSPAERVFGEVAPTLDPVAKTGAATPGGAEATAEDAGASRAVADEAARERALRRELADGVDPGGAALELVALLTSREQHALALAAVEAGLARSPTDARLARMRAGLLRDVGRREAALQALREWDRAHPEGDPSVLMEIAELEWLWARRSEAAAALAELVRRFSAHPWYGDNRARLQAFAAELADAERPQSVAVRDLLADLRGARLPSVRMRAFHALQQASPSVQRQAVVVALADVTGVVRAEAVELAVLPQDELLTLCRGALSDEDWQVRAAAARRAADLPVRIAGPVLAEAIAREEAAPAFQAMHDGLQLVTGEKLALPAGGASSARVRARIADHWSVRWGR